MYVIGASDCPVKIGIADRVVRRLAELQTGCPDKLFVHHTFKVPFDMASVIEAAAHEALKEHHRHGEWFNVDKDVAAETIARLRAERIESRQVDARLNGDLIDRLAACYEISPGARRACVDYRERIDERDNEYVTHANGYILKECGMAAYAAFSLVIAQRNRLTGLRGHELTKAEIALTKAINALVEFDAKYSEIRADKHWKRKYAAYFRQRQAA